MPVPPAAVRFLIVFPVNVPIGELFRIPCTIVPIAVDVLLSELATVPPTVLFKTVHVTLEPVKHLIPYKLAAPVDELETVIPPTLLLLVVKLLEPKLKIPITSPALAELEVQVMLPVADIFPIVFPVISPTVARPLPM